jgi:hypothetical protein
MLDRPLRHRGRVPTRSATGDVCKSDILLALSPSPEQLAANLLQQREQCDAVLAIVFLHLLTSFVDQRYRAGPGTLTPASSQPACDAFRVAKRLAIQHGFEGVQVAGLQGLVYSRADFVNEYWRPTAQERRLDFQYYEHDISQFTRVIVETYKFVLEFQEATGYAPNGWATYFVNRPVKAKKPYGLYSSPGGVVLVRPVLLQSGRPALAAVRTGVQQACDPDIGRQRLADPDAMARTRRRDDPAQTRARALHHQVLRAIPCVRRTSADQSRCYPRLRGDDTDS